MFLGTNLRKIREARNLSQAEMAALLDVGEDAYGKYESGTRQPKIAVLIKFSKQLRLSIDVLVKADLRHTDLKALMKVGENRLLFPVVVDTDNTDKIEIIPVRSRAGYTVGFSDPEYIKKLPQMTLPFKITGKHRGFPIVGDSMPPAKDGSIVVGRFVESFNEVENGRTYIIITNDGPVYKRVYKKRGILELHSDNKAYKHYEVKQEDVLELWLFTCCINLTDNKPEEINLESVMQMLKQLGVQIEALKNK